MQQKPKIGQQAYIIAMQMESFQPCQLMLQLSQQAEGMRMSAGIEQHKLVMRSSASDSSVHAANLHLDRGHRMASMDLSGCYAVLHCTAGGYELL